MAQYASVRRPAREVRVGKIAIGGKNPVAVQSMTNTKGFEDSFAQMQALEQVGCDIIRMAVPDMAAAETLYRLKNAGIGMPIVADIHFDYRLALAAADAGADKIRLNPGNIGGDDRVTTVA